MKKKNNVLNVLIILAVFVILFSFTTFSGTDSTSGSYSSLFNIFFLVVMLIVIMSFVLINLRKAINIRNNLRRVTNELKQGTGWQQIHFSNKYLQNSFEGYVKEMDRLSKINKSQNSQPPVVCDIEDYINIQLINGLINKSLCESVSGSMTGLGLLGTFLGLIIGLKDFSTDYDGIQNSILMLLNGIKTSFLTSIYGVVFSLVFNWIYRRSYTDMINSLNEFHNVFHNEAVNNSQNNINSRLVAAQENITENLEKIFEFIANDISEHFKTSINTMTDSIEHYLEASVTSQEEKLRVLVEQYLKTMNEEVLGGQLEELRKTLRLINDSNIQHYEKVRALSEMIAESGKSFLMMSNQYSANVESLQGYIEQLRSYQQEITNGNNYLAENMNTLTIRYDAQNEGLINLTNQLGNLNKVIDHLMNLCSNLEESVIKSEESRQNFAENAEKLIRQVETSSNEVNQYAVETAEVSKDVAQKLCAYTQSNLNESVSALIELSERFKSTSENIGTAYEQLSDRLNNGLEQSFAAFDSNTSEIIQKFSDIIEDIKSSADYIPYRLNQAIDREFEERHKERERLLSIVMGNEDNSGIPQPESDTENMAEYSDEDKKDKAPV